MTHSDLLFIFYRAVLIKNYIKKFFLLAALAFCVFPLLGQSLSALDWHSLPPLPPAPGESEQHGLAGGFVGTHQEMLIFGGGANFPQAKPWEGGIKKWWDDIYVMRPQAENQLRWEWAGKLPKPIGYGLSISTEHGLLCIGGNDASRAYSQVIQLSWEEETERILIDSLPSLPIALANMSGDQIDQTIYVVGGESMAGVGKYFFALDLRADPLTWEALPPWPGSPLTHCMAVAQQDGEREKLFIFGGRYPQQDSLSVFNEEGFVFDPQGTQAGKAWAFNLKQMEKWAPDLLLHQWLLVPIIF